MNSGFNHQIDVYGELCEFHLSILPVVCVCNKPKATGGVLKYITVINAHCMAIRSGS